MSNVIPFPNTEPSDSIRGLTSPSATTPAAIDYRYSALCLQEIVKLWPHVGNLLMRNIVDVHQSLSTIDEYLQAEFGKSEDNK